MLSSVSKSKPVTLIFVLALVAPLAFLDGAQAGSVEIVIDSPVEGAVYNSCDVALKYKAVHPDLNDCRVYFYLDGELLGYGASEDMVLTGLSNGKHTILIFQHQYSIGSHVPTSEIFTEKHISFFVDTGVAPVVSVAGLSKFNSNQAVVLNVTTGSPDATVSYCLNGGGNVSLPLNRLVNFHDQNQYCLNFPDLDDGNYILTAYVSDALYTGVAEKSFTVGDDATKVPIHQPTDISQGDQSIRGIAVIVGGAIVGVVLSVAVVLVLYRKNDDSIQAR